MDMLSKYKATIDCYRGKVTFAPEGETPFVLVRSASVPRVLVISTLGIRVSVQRKCTGSLASVGGTTRSDVTSPGSTRVVCDYADVFPDSLPGLPPQREIEFVIDLVSGLSLFPRPHTAWLQPSSRNSRYNCRNFWT